MATSWTHTTFAQAKDFLARELGDPSMVFFTDEELGIAIVEALRTWGLAAQYWRETGKVVTQAGKSTYKVEDDVEDLTGTLKLQDFTVTDREVLTSMMYALMEPPIVDWAGGWIGSEMYTLADLTNSLQQSRNSLLKDSGEILQSSEQVVTPGVNRIDISEDIVRVVRTSFEEVESDGPLTIWAQDNWQLQGTVAAAVVPAVGRPKQYALNYVPQLAMDLWPAPENAGTVKMESVEMGAPLTPMTADTSIGLPDDFSWVAKYRALSELYENDGLGRAPEMAQWAEGRWRQGLDLIASHQSILWAVIGGRRMTICSQDQTDRQRPRWEQQEGSPKIISQLSWNTFTISPVPDGEYIITLEIVRKAPIPVGDDDYIQIDSSYLQTLIDIAHHIACVKMQGQEFQVTQSLFDQAMDDASDYAASQASICLNWRWQQAQQQRDRWSRPYRARQSNESAKALAGGTA